MPLTGNKKCRPRYPRPASPESGKGASCQARQTHPCERVCRCVCLTREDVRFNDERGKFPGNILPQAPRRTRLSDQRQHARKTILSPRPCSCIYIQVLICAIKKIDTGPKMNIGIHAISAGHRFARSGLGGLAAIW